MKKLLSLMTVSLLFTACASESEDISGRQSQQKSAQKKSVKKTLTIGFETHQIAPTGTLDGPRSEVTFVVSGSQEQRVQAKAQGFCVEDKKRPSAQIALKCFHAGLATSFYMEASNDTLKFIQETLDERGEPLKKVLKEIPTQGAQISIASPLNVITKTSK